MSRGVILSFAVVSILGAVTSAQTCIDGLCFVDRAQTGEIDVGSLAGGPAVIDFDNDGWMDLYIGGRSSLPHRLYRNITDTMRPGMRTFEDVTAGSGFDDADGLARLGRGAIVADFDNDGDQDIYILGNQSSDTSSGLLYRNETGGIFTNVSEAAGVRTFGEIAESAAWFDFDLDGLPDLLVGYATTSTRALNLYHNQGDGTFLLANTLLPTLGVPGRLYAMTPTDIDLDGWPDVVMLSTAIGPTLLHNISDGAGGRTFVNVAGAVGFNFLGPAPMGVSAGDFDNDGDFDLALSNGAVGVYYENLGGTFQRITPIESFWAWAVSWLDADNDGLLDLFHAGSLGQGAANNMLFRNLGGGSFADVSAALHDEVLTSKSGVRIDIGNDGRPDLVIANPSGTDRRTSVMENISTTTGAWIMIDLVGDGRLVNTDALGAIVRVRAGGVTRHREIVSGSSAAASEDLRAHFGLGEVTEVDWVEIVWPRRGSLPSRTERVSGPIAPGQILSISPRCLGDYNADDSVDTRDVLAFLNDWVAGDPRADLNGDGFVNTQDVLLFLNEWNGGCV